MAISSAVCDSYCQEILRGVHQETDDYYIAVYQPSATLSRATTVYAATGEVANTGDYVAGGQLLVGFTVGLVGTTSYIDWTTDPQWSNVTFSAAGALVYNATRGNKACTVLTWSPVANPAGVPFVINLLPPGADATIHIANP